MKKQKSKSMKKILWIAAIFLFITVGMIGLYRIILLIFFLDKTASLSSVLLYLAGSCIDILIGILAFIELKKKYILKRYLN